MDVRVKNKYEQLRKLGYSVSDAIKHINLLISMKVMGDEFVTYDSLILDYYLFPLFEQIPFLEVKSDSNSKAKDKEIFYNKIGYNGKILSKKISDIVLGENLLEDGSIDIVLDDGIYICINEIENILKSEIYNEISKVFQKSLKSGSLVLYHLDENEKSWSILNGRNNEIKRFTSSKVIDDNDELVTGNYVSKDKCLVLLKKSNMV